MSLLGASGWGELGLGERRRSPARSSWKTVMATSESEIVHMHERVSCLCLFTHVDRDLVLSHPAEWALSKSGKADIDTYALHLVRRYALSD